MSVGSEGVHEGLPGEVKIFFVKGLIFPIEEESFFALVQGTVGSGVYSSLFGIALRSGRAVLKRIAGGHARHPPSHRRPCCLLPELCCFQSTDRKPFTFAMSIFDQIILLHFIQNS